MRAVWRMWGNGGACEKTCNKNDDEVVIPDVSIICNMRDRKNVSFTGIPRFVMEVLSDATENYDRNEKMDIYIEKSVFLNTGSWIGERNKSKSICLTGKTMIPVIHIFIEQLRQRIRKIYKLWCFRICTYLLMNYLILNSGIIVVQRIGILYTEENTFIDALNQRECIIKCYWHP